MSINTSQPHWKSTSTTTTATTGTAAAAGGGSGGSSDGTDDKRSGNKWRRGTSSSEQGGRWRRNRILVASASIGMIALVTVLMDKYLNGYFTCFGEKDPSKRETIVILGTGWGAIGFFEHVDLSKYNVLIVSPRNYSLFTPMLASLTTGHIDSRSIAGSIHDHIDRRKNVYKKFNPKVEFYEAKCVDVNWDKQFITCEQTNTQKHLLSHLEEKQRTFQIPYDKLVIAVGCRTNTFNTPGVVENCYFLKEIEDAHNVRMQIWTNLERANCPGIPEEQLKRMLNFCVVGGGPTGVEFAGELCEVFKREVRHFFPRLADHVKITVVQSADHILNTFDEKMTEYAEKRFLQEGIRVVTNSRVVRVTHTDLVIYDKKEKKQYEMPYGMCLWATGIMQHPLIEILANNINSQTHTRSLEVDPYLRVSGVTNGNIYALGDCCKVNQPLLFQRMGKLFEEADLNKDGYIQLEELIYLGKKKAEEYPHLALFVEKSIQDFHKFDVDKNGKLDLQEFENLLKYVDNRLTPLPATAQVANQQGKYLAHCLNKKEESVKPFRYRHLGSFAYLGSGSAVADISGHVGSGIQAWIAYKLVYFAKQVSWKNKAAIASDWVRTALFGRDMSKV